LRRLSLEIEGSSELYLPGSRLTRLNSLWQGSQASKLPKTHFFGRCSAMDGSVIRWQWQIKALTQSGLLPEATLLA
jgi:hypothetical protein